MEDISMVQVEVQDWNLLSWKGRSNDYE